LLLVRRAADEVQRMFRNLYQETLKLNLKFEVEFEVQGEGEEKDK
jgi:hypothetical protein